jgi:hypothetical protein
VARPCGADMQGTGSVLKQWNKLCSVKRCHDDGFLAVLQLLLTLQIKNGVWNKWATNNCAHVLDPKNLKVTAFMTNILEKFRPDTLAVQHHEKGNAQAATHYDFGGGGIKSKCSKKYRLPLLQITVIHFGMFFCDAIAFFVYNSQILV